MIIKRITSLPDTLPELMAQARTEGYHFLERLHADFDTGANRFAEPKEALFAVISSNQCLGIGGVNEDPINNLARVGRLRRVYISPALRGKGLGRQLILEIERWCINRFDELQLFTDSLAAAAFYESLGYEQHSGDRISHRKLITSSKL